VKWGNASAWSRKFQDVDWDGYGNEEVEVGVLVNGLADKSR